MPPGSTSHFGSKLAILDSGLPVELVPLVLRINGEPKMYDVGADGRFISAYFEHRTWDEWGAEVAQQRTQIPASSEFTGCKSGSSQ